MKQITLEEAGGKTIIEVLGSDHRDLLLVFKSNEFSLINDSGYFTPGNFNIKDMLRLGFVTRDQLDAAERVKKREEEAAEYKEYKRLRDKFEF